MECHRLFCYRVQSDYDNTIILTEYPIPMRPLQPVTTFTRLATVFAFIALLTSFPASAQDIDETALQQAATSIETSIKSAMSSAGREGQPTLQQLGGVQAGSTDSDASGGAGGDGSSGGGGGSGGPGGSSPGE